LSPMCDAPQSRERIKLGTYRGVKTGLELRKRAEKGVIVCP
jgi:hypothetical protein